MDRVCDVCCKPEDREKGPVAQYLSGEIDGEEYEGGNYHDECALAVGMPEQLMA